MSEKVRIKLRCPVCSRTRIAVVREASENAYVRGDTSVFVYEMPDGFKAVARKTNAFNGDFDIDCTHHHVSAIGHAR